jgi:glyceraldehyde 3-phosphate dehydrogenase
MTKRVKIGINGFGRIGRSIARILAEKDTGLELTLINDLTDEGTLAHLLEFDSVHGKANGAVSCKDGVLSLAGKPGVSARISAKSRPEEIPWSAHGVELVLECTGLFTDRSKAASHINGSVKRVLISAPSQDADVTIVRGVNHEKLDLSKHTVVSCGSCTTNCLAPIAAVIHKEFGIVRGSMTTIHSYTNDQRILDLPHKDLRRARAAALSMIPTSTGAAKAIGLVIPELAGKLDGLAIRVPTPNVSLLDLVCEVSRNTSRDELVAVLKAAAANSSVLDVTERELVSVDFNGCSKSAVVDLESSSVIGERMVKVLAWYDNETGFSTRMVELAAQMVEVSRNV